MKEIGIQTSKRRQIANLLVSAAVLWLALWLCTDLTFANIWWAGLAVVIAVILQALVQPIFGRVSRLLGVFATIIIAFVGYGTVLWLTLNSLPTNDEIGFRQAIVVAWVYAVITSLIQWATLVSTGDYLLQTALRAASRYSITPTEEPGFLYVQLDGVSSELLRWQLSAGNLPNIQRLIEAENYQLTPWQTQLPSTTPASQAGILFGHNDGIPAFRWYERTSQSMVVANQRSGAALIEQRLSDGDGLLADDGVSIGNLFSGDAATSIMVISKMSGHRLSLDAMHNYTDYFISPSGFMRSIVLSVGEMIKEFYQAHRQVSHDLRPRVPRHGSYVLLRAGTNVLLRDLQTRIVLDQMLRGRKSIYVDFLDYDEIAHHAGVARPESLAALAGLDQVVGTLMRLRDVTPRPYHLILLSDHGQSQGDTFRQLHDGTPLQDYVAELVAATSVTTDDVPAEDASASRMLLDGNLANSHTGTLFTRRAERDDISSDTANQVATSTDVIFTGSGNLGNIWLPQRYRKRPTYEQLSRDVPRLIPGLLALDGIGLVIVKVAKNRYLCIGTVGTIDLISGVVTGKNPLSAYAWTNLAALRKLARNPHAPDIQIISSVEPVTGAVHAFEELVGNHGGIGGNQTDAMLLHPRELPIPASAYTDDIISDSTTVHRILKSWQQTK